MKQGEELPTTSENEIEGLIKRIKSNQLSEGDKKLAARLLRLVLVLLRMVESKNASIARLKKFLFGPRTEKRQSTTTNNSEPEKEGATGNEQQNKSAPTTKTRKPGH